MNTNDPTSVFLANIARCRAAMEAIQSELDEHMGADPEAVHWTNVAMAGSLASDLEAIVARFTK
jgi:hypothetical protein